MEITAYLDDPTSTIPRYIELGPIEYRHIVSKHLHLAASLALVITRRTDRPGD